MPRLSVDPSVLDGAGVRLADIGGTVGLTVSTLSGALADCAGMCGDDPVGEAMGRSYDRTASALVAALAEARNALVNLADGVRVWAFNWVFWWGLPLSLKTPNRRAPTSWRPCLT
jgi:hypothetical protein